MNAIEGRGFQSDDQLFQIRTTAEEIQEILRHLHCAGLIVRYGECVKRLLRFKIQKGDDIASGADIDPDEESRKKIRLLQK